MTPIPAGFFSALIVLSFLSPSFANQDFSKAEPPINGSSPSDPELSSKPDDPSPAGIPPEEASAEADAPATESSIATEPESIDEASTPPETPDFVQTSDQQIEKWKSWIAASSRPHAVEDINFRSFYGFMTNLKTLISLHWKYDQGFHFMWAQSDRIRYQVLLDSLYRDMSQMLPRLRRPTSEYEVSSHSWPYRGTLKLQFEEMGVELMLLEVIKFNSEDPFYQRSVDRLLAIGEICRNEFKNWELGLLSRYLNQAIGRIFNSDLHLIFGGQVLHTLVDLDPSLKQTQIDYLANELATERPKKPLKASPSTESGLRAAYRLATLAKKADIRPVRGDLTQDLKPKLYKYSVGTVSNLRAIGLLFQVLGQLGRHPSACEDVMIDQSLPKAAEQNSSNTADLWEDSTSKATAL